MIRRPTRSTRTDTSFPTRRSSDLISQPPAPFRRREIIAHWVACERGSGPIAGDRAIRLVGEGNGKGVVSDDKTRDGGNGDRERGDQAAAHREAPGVISVPSLLRRRRAARSEEHTSELQSLMRISYAVFCL